MTIRAANSIINRETTYDININVGMPLPIGSSIRIKISSSVKITADTGALILSSAEGQLPLYKAMQVTLLDTAS